MASNTYQTKLTAKDLTAAAFRSVGQRVTGLGKQMAKLSGAFAIAGVGAGAALTKSSMATIDNLAKTADKIGTTTEALGGLRHAAELTGVSSNTLDMAMQRLTRRVSEAADGTGEAKGALQELGLNAVELEKLPLDTQMEKIADAMGGLDTQADKVRIAMKLFDSEGVSLVNTLSGGSAGLSEMAAEAEQLGITISRVDAAQIEAANDSVTRAKGVFEGLGNQLAVAFSPLVEEVANNFRQAALDNEDFGTIGQRVAQAMVTAYGKLADGLFFVRLGFKMLGVNMLKVARVLLEKIDPAFQFIIDKYNKVAEFFGMELIPQDKIQNSIDGLTSKIETGLDEISVLLNTPLPSEGIQATFDNIVASARRAAEEIAEKKKDLVPTPNPDELQKTVGFMERIQIESGKRLVAFEQKNAFERTQAVTGELGTMFSAVASNNKKRFAMNKALGIAQAIMNTSEAATLAYKSYPPPLNYVMAAGTIAAGLAQVAQIKAQSFMGGGFTGKGGRGGTGLDGYGGQLAMLHPNEVVLDTKKPGGVMPSVNIVNNVDATGADESKVQAAIEAASRETIVTIQDLMSRGRFA